MRIKHTVIGSLFIAGFALGLGFFVADDALAAQSPEGALVSDSQTIFLIKGGEKRPFRSPDVFHSHGNDFDDVVPESAEDRSLPVGAVMIFRDGTLVKGPSSPLVYLVTEGGKRPFVSENAFLGRGYSFNNVVTANEETFDDLPTGSELQNLGPIGDGGRHPAGTLVNDSGTIYELTVAGKKAFTSIDDFYSHGHNFSKVVLATTADRALPHEGIVPRRDIIKR